MKRLTTLFMLGVFALLWVACGGNPPAAEEPAVQPEVTNTVPQPLPTATLPPAIVTESGGNGGSAEAEQTDTVADPVSSVVGPWPPDVFGYGVQVHGNATVGDPAEIMSSVRNQLGLDWVKVQLQWFVVERADREQWFFYDSVIEQAHANGLHLLLSVVAAPEWTRAAGNHQGPPDDYGAFADFLTRLIERYPDQIDAIEVWNEQNLDREWQTASGISPEDYVEFLALANNTIKSLDPEIIVISGALSPTGPGDWVRWADDFEYLDRALAAGMLDHADCVGAHHNGYNVPPDVRVEDTNGLPEAQTAVFRGPFDNQYTGNTLNHLWTFKSTMDGYVERVRAYDPEMKLCVTEFGWASSQGYDQAPQGFEFALDNTLQEQADYLVQAFGQMQASGDYWLAFAFNYDFGNKGSGPTDDPVPYSIIDTNGAPRPAFDAVAAMEKIR